MRPVSRFISHKCAAIAVEWGVVDIARSISGVALVEFAFALPVLLMMMVGMFVFGIALHDYLAVTNAAEAGAFQLVVSRGDNTPWTDTTNAVYAAAPTLPKSRLTVDITVNGTAYSSDATCLTALNSAMGAPASVKVSYPCSAQVLHISYLQNCTLTATPSGRIQ